PKVFRELLTIVREDRRIKPVWRELIIRCCPRLHWPAFGPLVLGFHPPPFIAAAAHAVVPCKRLSKDVLRHPPDFGVIESSAYCGFSRLLSCKRFSCSERAVQI